MQKIQILFPEPVLARLRGLAEAEDRPVSEIVRRAVERLIQQTPPVQKSKRTFPTFRGGGILLSADRLKEELYSDGDLRS